MTITAIDAQTAGVVQMTERDGLLRSNVLVGDVRGALELHQRGADCTKKKDNTKKAGASQRVCTAIKDLRHE